MLGTAYADSLVTVVLLRLLLGVAEAAFFVASPRWQRSLTWHRQAG